MHNELKQTDIKFVAEGCWYNYFRWNWLPEVKIPWLVALITFVAGLAVILGHIVDSANSAVVESGPSATGDIAAALVLVALGFFIWGIFIRDKAKDQFVTSVLDRWEDGNHEIPDAGTVEEFINNHKAAQ